MAKKPKSCGWPLWFEQIGGMRVTRDGNYSARCSVCMASVLTKGPRKRICTAPSRMTPFPAGLLRSVSSDLDRYMPFFDFSYVRENDAEKNAEDLRRFISWNVGKAIYEAVVKCDLGSATTGVPVPATFHGLVLADSADALAARFAVFDVIQS